MVSSHNRILAVLKCDPYEQCFQQPIEFDFDSLSRRSTKRQNAAMSVVYMCCVLVVSTLVLEPRALQDSVRI